MSHSRTLLRNGRPAWAARFLRARLDEVNRCVPPAPRIPVPDTWDDNAITLAWLGHATVLINFYGVRIVTDPVLFPRIGVNALVGTLGPLRLVASALPAARLPEVDLVLVSHAHFDHLDRRSLASLPGRPVAVTAAATGDLLPRRRLSSVHELRWHEREVFETRRGRVAVRALEVKHWGARMGRDTYRGYNGYVIEREGRRLLFGGDTASTPLFKGYRQLGPFDAAMMPIGAYDPWIWHHCTPEQAVAMANDAGAAQFVPIHHRTFRLSREAVDEPLERAALALRDEPERLVIREVGQTAVVAR